MQLITNPTVRGGNTTLSNSEQQLNAKKMKAKIGASEIDNSPEI